MSGAPKAAMKVVVAGGTFGRIYAAGVQVAEGFELAGVLGQGGTRTAALAREHGVPVFTGVGELPADVDIACVVVRSGVVGGRGSELAVRLLERGIHVLQEQPVHADELASCLRAAHRNRVGYRLNSFYPHVSAVAAFLRAAARLRARQPIRFVDATCAVQVAFPMVDLLGLTTGALRPWRFDDLAAARGPYRSVAGVIGGVPLTLRVQNQLDRADPDNHAHLLHRITVGTDGGVLTLADVHGPVLWSPRLHVPRDGPELGRLELPAVSELAPAATSYRDLLVTHWPTAVAAALRALAGDVAAGVSPLRLGQYHLTACQVWQELTSRLGRPDLIDHPPAAPLDAGSLLEDPVS